MDGEIAKKTRGEDRKSGDVILGGKVTGLTEDLRKRKARVLRLTNGKLGKRT